MKRNLWPVTLNMHRFFCPNLEVGSKIFILSDKKEVHHLKNVLRLKKEDSISLFNGEGKQATGRIKEISQDQIKVLIETFEPKTASLKIPVILACAIPKKAKLDFIIEKGTELGVDEIIPMITQRTEVHLKKDNIQKKLNRYRAVAITAAKQCKRLKIPQIYSPQDYESVLTKINHFDYGLIPCLAGKRQNLLSALEKMKDCKRIFILIGPEGDFTPQELALAMKAGCLPISLGPAVLKVDTAALSALAVTQLFLNEETEAIPKTMDSPP